jgi:molybdopterin biosynthesis enzyme MoaB
MATVSVGILTVSDRCARGEAEDKVGLRTTYKLTLHLHSPERQGGPALAAYFAREAVQTALGGHVVVAATRCVSDEPPAIQAAVMQWCDRDALSLVVTTGGTGFSPRGARNSGQK